MYLLLLMLIYLAFISLGLPDSLLGSGWPAMHLNLNVPVSYMGVITMTISLGTIISSLFSNKITYKFGTSKVTLVSILLTSIGLFGFSISKNLFMILLFSIPCGIGAGAIDAALNNYVAINYSSRHMSWLHCFWGVGTIISPFIMSYALTNYSWRSGYLIVGIMQLIIFFIILIFLPVWNKAKKNMINNEKNKPLKLKEVIKIKGVIFLLVGFFCYCAAESTAMTWASTYFVQVKKLNIENAAKLASLFYIGITFSRFLSGFVTNKLGDKVMIKIGTIVLIFGVLMLFIPAKSDIFSFVAFVIIGFGCGPIYPSIIHSTPNNFGSKNSSAIVGIQMASAYMGSTFISPLFGVLGKSIGFYIMPIFLLVFIIIMIISLNYVFKKTNK